MALVKPSIYTLDFARPLLQFASRNVTQTSARTPQIMRSKLAKLSFRGNSLTTHQITFSETLSPQTVPVLLTQRKNRPEVTGAAVVQQSRAVLTHSGTGTVRMCPPLPYRSTMTHRSSRFWMSDTAYCATSDRRRPHPASTAIIARSLLPFRTSRSGDRRSCLTSSALSQFPSRTPTLFAPLTLPMPAANSGLNKPVSAASYASRRPAASRRLIVADDSRRDCPPGKAEIVRAFTNLRDDDIHNYSSSNDAVVKG